VGEFELIDKYFRRPPRSAVPATEAGMGAIGAGLGLGGSDAVLGIGDDGAVLAPVPGRHWVVSSDMLVEGRHFLSTVAPERLGHKALAVNLSDLAAMGARPVAFTLALALPRADEAFIAPLAAGLFALADAHGIELVGGDTTAGPLNLCITVFGDVPPDQALLRSGARAGDELWVSGTLGDARLALEVFRGRVDLPGSDFATVRRAMELPQPRVTLGQALRGVASSAIDLSDGLLGDLGHVLRRSGVAALVEVDALPRSAVLARQPTALQHDCLLAGGDDYELLFTAAPARHAAVLAAGRAAGVAVTCCGRIEAGAGARVVDAAGQLLDVHLQGFDHFKSA
jgi:thiamine-monophosphate kinase